MNKPRTQTWEYVIIAACIIVNVSPENRIFKLPRLILHADQYYLVKRKGVDLSCQIEPGWRGATMADVHWIKDGIPIIELENADTRSLLVANGPTLRIQSGRHHAEGDYQCSAVVRGVRISNGQHIDTRLVSAPVKFRRARITKFEKTSSQSLTVFQGQIARLPCTGMPDVVPGPPKVTFEKTGSDKPLSTPGDGRILCTTSGMQIAYARHTDSGSYRCIVGNTFTNQTRKSPHIVKLEVLTKRFQIFEPEVVFPESSSSLNDPIIVDVVKGQPALLECIITSARVTWTKLYHSGRAAISLSYEKARFQQIWGNLRIVQVTEADSGIYICQSVGLFPNGITTEYPKVYYYLRVHAPTDVQLMLEQVAVDKSWKLSCLALNLHYEIPMVYINGLALIDAMDQLGVPPHTNFFTNPINATLMSNVALSGSVQCISRPAMDEAEVYGNGLERGRAMNLYVDNRLNQHINLILQGPENSTKFVGETAQLVCLVVPRTTRTIWTKDGKRMALIGEKRVRLVGTASLQISDVQLEDEGWYTCQVTDNTNHMTRRSAYLKIEQKASQYPGVDELGHLSNGDLQRVGNEKESRKLLTMEVPQVTTSGRSVLVQWLLDKSQSLLNKVSFLQVEIRTKGRDVWVVGKRVETEVKAVIFKDLLPGSYQFRLVAKLYNQTVITSQATEWIPIPSTTGIRPVIEHLEVTSDNSILLKWKFVPRNPQEQPNSFVVLYGNSSFKNFSHKVAVKGSNYSIVLDDLEPSTQYKVIVVAVLESRTNVTSETVYAQTYERNGTSVSDQDHTGIKTEALEGTLFTIFLLLLPCACIVIAVVLSGYKRRKLKAFNREAKGKFMDTSRKIFNEQKIEKTHMYYDPELAIELEESIPLKVMKVQNSDQRMTMESDI